MTSIQYHRSGYGASFNSILIHKDEIEKRPLNPYGLTKLAHEKKAYIEFKKAAPEFPLAKGFRSTESSLFVHYYKDYLPLWKVYKDASLSVQAFLLKRVFQYLSALHRKTRIEVSKQEYTLLLRAEIIEKVVWRYTEVSSLFEKYPFRRVNGIEVLSFDECIRRLETKLAHFTESKQEFSFSYIHGDPQFNNILSSKDTADIVFIDPRGYFGSNELYGVAEYDIAKVLFALSGYDVFDNTESFDIKIEKENLHVPDFCLDSQFASLYQEIQFILCSIWLANAHCFVNNPQKALISHAYARYLTTILLSR